MAQSDFPELDKVDVILPFEKGKLTSRMGCRKHPTRDWKPFVGINLSQRKGTPIVAVADGKVLSSGWRGAWGIMTILEHGDNWRTYYGHQDTTKVEVGDVVKQGQEIGTLGTTGRTTGPVISFLVTHKNKFHNPLNFYRPEKQVVPTFTACGGEKKPSDYGF